MAVDYNRYSDWSEFYYNLDLNNRIGNEVLYPGGYTKYQQYYTDMLGFWRDLYNADLEEDRNKQFETWNNLFSEEGTYSINQPEN